MSDDRIRKVRHQSDELVRMRSHRRLTGAVGVFAALLDMVISAGYRQQGLPVPGLVFFIKLVAVAAFALCAYATWETLRMRYDSVDRLTEWWMDQTLGGAQSVALWLRPRTGRDDDAEPGDGDEPVGDDDDPVVEQDDPDSPPGREGDPGEDEAAVREDDQDEEDFVLVPTEILPPEKGRD